MGVDSQPLKSVKLIISFLREELRAVLGAHSIPGCIFIYVSLFFFIFFSNFIGLMPYIFTCTSHLLLTLLGSQGPNLAFVGLIGLVIALILLLLLEVAVACIQSYVLTILSSLYLGELTTPGFTLKITK